MASNTHHGSTYAASGPLAPTLNRAEPILLAVLRIGAGLLFMQHGAQKLLGMFGGFGAPGATAPLMSMMGLAGVLELVGGLMIVLGLLTRPVAFLLAGEMVVAYFMAHAPQGGVPMENGGELTLLYALIFLYFVAAGAGPLSIDSAMARRREGASGLPGAASRAEAARRDNAA